MLSKYTIVGMAVGIVISGIGIWALADAIINPVRIVEFDENLEAGNNQTYSFNAPSNSEQKIAVVGDSARIDLTKPGEPENGYVFKRNGDISWKLADGGHNIVKVQNTGESDLNISGAFEVEKDPIFFTYHILVITSGVIIMGFSAVFSVRKPRGF
jgi:hypothetical protein